MSQSPRRRRARDWLQAQLGVVPETEAAHFPPPEDVDLVTLTRDFARQAPGAQLRFRAGDRGHTPRLHVVWGRAAEPWLVGPLWWLQCVVALALLVYFGWFVPDGRADA